MTRQPNIKDWTDEEVAVADDLGFEEIERRADGLADYYLYDTVVSFYNTHPLNPDQAITWAKLAASLGNGHLVDGTNIKVRKGFDALALQVVRNEIYKRQQDERKRQEADSS